MWFNRNFDCGDPPQCRHALRRYAPAYLSPAQIRHFEVCLLQVRLTEQIT